MPELGSLMVLLRGSTSISVGVFIEQNICKICNGPGIEKRGLYVCRGLRTVNLQLQGRGREHVARNDNNLWLCDRGLESFFPRSLLDRLQSRARAGYAGAAFLKIWRPWARNTVGIFQDNSD